ncbi:hypothetical protein L5515_011044 [Caenorhabditis briggsae]|uniref:Uncharacterized protein n=1 Tax=Caenorhabditis briggsae TaxID=6238 RepID=A0AAE9JGG2_CAEBR|nr:hypothetical protein L5515_011044 [Caenorhabditis briggsae]
MNLDDTGENLLRTPGINFSRTIHGIEGSESEASTEDLQDTEGQGRTDETLLIEKENTTMNTDNLLESFVDTEGPVISNSCDDNINIITDSILRINSSISDSSSSGSPHNVRSPSLKEKFFHGYMYADTDDSGKEDKMHRLNRTNDRVEKKNESPTTNFRSSSRKSAKRALEQTELAKCT